MTSALVGASSVEQLRENVSAVRQLAIGAEELARIDRIVGTTPDQVHGAD
jgi:L-glyceraldehyde 3-phosphate reductase